MWHYDMPIFKTFAHRGVRRSVVLAAGPAELISLAGSTASDEADDISPSISSFIIEAPSSDVWEPVPGTTWQRSLEELPVNTSLNVQVDGLVDRINWILTVGCFEQG